MHTSFPLRGLQRSPGTLTIKLWGQEGGSKTAHQKRRVHTRGVLFAGSTGDLSTKNDARWGKQVLTTGQAVGRLAAAAWQLTAKSLSSQAREVTSRRGQKCRMRRYWCRLGAWACTVFRGAAHPCTRQMRGVAEGRHICQHHTGKGESARRIRPAKQTSNGRVDRCSPLCQAGPPQRPAAPPQRPAARLTIPCSPAGGEGLAAQRTTAFHMPVLLR